MLLFVLFSSMGYSQDTITTKNKWIIASYSGGRSGYSGISLDLYSDSSYTYSGWSDGGHSWGDSGTYKRADSLIRLYPKKYTSRKGYKKQITKNQGSVYRIQKNTILFYSIKEDKKDPYFYKEYFTLYRDENSK
jgi:hypothetical protein